MALRVLVVCQYFWPESFRINDVAAELVARGHKVTVLCGTPNYPAGRFFDGFSWAKRTSEFWQGVKIVRVPVVPRGKGRKLGLIFNFLSFALSGVVFGPMRCRDQYDLVLVYQLSPVTMGIPGLMLSSIKRIPMVFWVQDIWPESVTATGATQNRLALSVLEWLVRMLYRSSRLVLIQSRAFREPVASRGVSLDRICYLPSSAESLYEPLERSEAHEALAMIPYGTRILFAGNIGVAQDFGTILAAAELTRHEQSIIWLVAGDGRMREWVETEIERRGLGATMMLLGRFPVSDMPRLFAGVDALLVTLRKEPIFALTIPAKIQSYLACAKPVIGALDGEGARVIAESGAGLCVSAEDPSALAAAVVTLSKMAMPARVAMGRSGRKYFDTHFRIDKHIDELEALLAEAVGRR
jgi:glycosyltransferase involved in cell wall biosynthesis